MDVVAAKTIVVCVVIALMQDPDYTRTHRRLYGSPSSTLFDSLEFSLFVEPKCRLYQHFTLSLL
jgi:hypothetical protein